MKLQKLVYYSQGYALAQGFSLTNEQPQVWPYGPVFNSLYFELKYHGEELIFQPEGDDIAGRPPFISFKDEKHNRVIKKVWNKLKDYTGIQLSALTHKNGTPWSDVVNRYGRRIPKNHPISAQAMETYFRTHEL